MKRLVLAFSLFFVTTLAVQAQRSAIDSLFAHYAGQTMQNTIDSKMLARTGPAYKKAAKEADSTELQELKQVMELLGRVKEIRTLSMVPGMGGAPDMYSGFDALFGELKENCGKAAKDGGYKLVSESDKMPFIHIWYAGAQGDIPAAFLFKVEYSRYSQLICSVWGDLNEQDALLLQQTLAPGQ